MLTWYRELGTTERRTFWACFGGWALEGFDAQLYSFLIPALIVALGMTRTEAGLMGTASLLAASVGGAVSGILSDCFGRVKILQWSIVWFCVFTFLTGFAHSIGQLLAARILQGLGYGAEWSAGAVLIGEIIRPQNRGRAVGCVQTAFPLGWGAAAIASSLLLTHLPHDYGWRAVFWTGLLPALLVLYIRRNVRESTIFSDAQKKQIVAGKRARFTVLFHRKLIGRTFLASLLAWGVTGSGIVLTAWLPTFLGVFRHFPLSVVGSSILIAAVGGFFGYVTNAYLSDAIGRRGNVLLFAACAAVMTYVYVYAPVSDAIAVVQPLSFLYGFFTTGIYVSLASFFTELFPTEIRARGQSFAYYLGRGVGALAISFVGALSVKMSLGTAMGSVAIAGYCTAIISVLCLPETKGLDLTSLSLPSPDEDAPSEAQLGRPADSTHF